MQRFVRWQLATQFNDAMLRSIEKKSEKSFEFWSFAIGRGYVKLYL
jgi:hypothetical protein